MISTGRTSLVYTVLSVKAKRQLWYRPTIPTGADDDPPWIYSSVKISLWKKGGKLDSSITPMPGAAAPWR